MALVHVHMLVIHAAIYFTNGGPKNFEGERKMCCIKSHLGFRAPQVLEASLVLNSWL